MGVWTVHRWYAWSDWSYALVERLTNFLHMVPFLNRFVWWILLSFFHFNLFPTVLVFHCSVESATCTMCAIWRKNPPLSKQLLHSVDSEKHVWMRLQLLKNCVFFVSLATSDIFSSKKRFRNLPRWPKGSSMLHTTLFSKLYWSYFLYWFSMERRID